MKSRFSCCVKLIALGIWFSWVCQMWAQADLEKHPSCGYCGMNRAQFAHSRMFILREDGSEGALCSLHCAAIDIAVNLDKIPKLIQVSDYKTKQLLTADQAVWVIGGKKPGVMTKRAKWAFASKADAEAFIKENGGSLATYEEAIKATYLDMYEDTKMIQDRRKMKRMGK